MTDENTTAPEVETAVETTPAIPSEPKKTRSPRQKKIAADAVSVPMKALKSTRGPNKVRTAKSSDAAASDEEVGAVTQSKPGRGRKGIPRPRVAKSEAAPVIATGVDEFADLLALEEENRTLRASLSDKLRAENADLRRKLGRA